LKKKISGSIPGATWKKIFRSWRYKNMDWLLKIPCSAGSKIFRKEEESC